MSLYIIMAAMAQGAQKMDIDEPSASDIDRVSIESMSFCPTKSQVSALIAKANEAEAVRRQLKGEGNQDWRADKTGAKGQKLLSKLYFLPGKFGLCPDSLEPDDTILAKLGRGDIGPGGLPGDGALRVINDRNMPFGSTSCGPNGVLATTNGRMNLFYSDMGSTKKLLDQYISFRDENLHEIFGMYVTKIQTMAGEDNAMKLNPEKPETLSVDLHDDYRNVAAMFGKINEALSSGMSLSQCGISCNSFCQTWCLKQRGNVLVGEAQFSVMSPHFQTRFYVGDDANVKQIIGANSDELLKSYIKIIEHFDSIMAPDYGNGGGGAAFVNLDKLHDQFNSGGSSKKVKRGGKRKTRRRRRTKKKKRRRKKKTRKKRKKRKRRRRTKKN